MKRLILSKYALLHHTSGRSEVRAAGVLVNDGLIEAVVEYDAAASFPDAEVDDLGDAWLTPAFVDGHTHVALHALRGVTGQKSTASNVVEDLFYAFESGLTAEEVRAFARMGAWEALLHGTGAVFDHYFHATAVAEALAEVGLTGMVAPTIQDLGGPFAHAADAALADVVALDSPEWAARGIATALGPHAMDTVSSALWQRIADLAQARDLPIHVHVAQSLEEVARVAARSQRSPVAELLARGALDAAPCSLLIHMVYADYADLDLLRDKRVTLGFCPHSAFVFGHPARPDHWRSRGLEYLVGSDCAASNDGMSARGELRALHGLPAWTTSGSEDYQSFLEGDHHGALRAWALRAQTRAEAPELLAPAALLNTITHTPSGVHPRFAPGVLRPGAPANLAVWDAEHPAFWPGLDLQRSLALGDASPALLHVMTNGTWRGQRGHYAESLRSGALYQEHRREASARLEQRLSRLGLGLAVRG